ncbi:hypothetical protein, partial [Shewanella sp.]|uniref:hypothetical protein n=1 Tax=Shewanella sp. TaxID=50422 RepID=UPI003A88D2DE
MALFPNSKNTKLLVLNQENLLRSEKKSTTGQGLLARFSCRDKRCIAIYPFRKQSPYSGKDPKDIEAALRPNLEKVFPQLKGVRIDYEWGGMIG